MVIRFVDRLFDLPPLAELPDEAAAGALGERSFGQPYLGPADAGVPGVGDLMSGFDPARLFGDAPPLPPALYRRKPIGAKLGVAAVPPPSHPSFPRKREPIGAAAC